jgi:Na+-translocating ferredoxin:NAD+ oxidoreductase RnfC subunit
MEIPYEELKKITAQIFIIIGDSIREKLDYNERYSLMDMYRCRYKKEICKSSFNSEKFFQDVRRECTDWRKHLREEREKERMEYKRSYERTRERSHEASRERSHEPQENNRYISPDERVLQSYGIIDKSSFKHWIIHNHPDRNKPVEIFRNVYIIGKRIYK